MALYAAEYVNRHGDVTISIVVAPDLTRALYTVSERIDDENTIHIRELAECDNGILYERTVFA